MSVLDGKNVIKLYFSPYLFIMLLVNLFYNQDEQYNSKHNIFILNDHRGSQFLLHIYYI
jgi:hypothetical protein